MANLPGTNIAATIRPFTDSDTYPTVVDTEIQGGYRSVTTIAERDAIPQPRRKEGMRVKVVGGKEYILEGGTANTNWQEIAAGEGGKGDPGEAATVAVGTVTTGAAGSSAQVTNSGTENAAVLNFTIPRGLDGVPGAATVTIGTVTTGAPGSLAQVTNTGTSTAAILNFTVPKGADGVDGSGGTTTESPNLFNKDDPTNITGAYVNTSGTEVPDARFYISHKVAVTPGEKLTMRYSEYAGGTFYDSSDAARSRFGAPSGTPNISPFTFTVPSYGAYLKMNGLIAKIGEDMLVRGETYPSEYMPFGTITTGTNSNPLAGKRILWEGDSICSGTGFSGGYAGIISAANGMLSTNYARGGATVAGGTTLAEGGNRHWISRSIGAMDAQADYIIFQGGINDYWLKVPLGAVTGGYADAFDDTTFAGAIESMFKLARAKWTSGKIGFIVNFKISGTSDVTGGTKSEKYWDIARKACEKWSIPCLDLYKTGGLNFEIAAVANAYSMDADGCHPNENGYKIIVPAITEWIKGL